LEISGLGSGEDPDPAVRIQSWARRPATQFDQPSQDHPRSDTLELVRRCGEKNQGLVTAERGGLTLPRASALLRIVVSPAVWKIDPIRSRATPRPPSKGSLACATSVEQEHARNSNSKQRWDAMDVMGFSFWARAAVSENNAGCLAVSENCASEAVRT
jgi:hypothetical protein